MPLYGDLNIARTTQFALLVLSYLEQTGLVPERFSSASRAAWHGVMPYLRELDLFEMAVRDGVRANPHLFVAFRDPAARNELRALDEPVWRQALDEVQSLSLAQMASRELYHRGAEALGIELPPVNEAVLLTPATVSGEGGGGGGNAFDRSSLIAELPNGCGYPSLLLCEMYDFLDPAHNLRLFVDGPEAEMLAAWALVLTTGQLTPPPGRIIPVSAEDPTALRREVFDAALVYRPVPWLSSNLQRLVTAKEVLSL